MLSRAQEHKSLYESEHIDWDGDLAATPKCSQPSSCTGEAKWLEPSDPVSAIFSLDSFG